jgi:hypothetical protein
MLSSVINLQDTIAKIMGWRLQGGLHQV